MSNYLKKLDGNYVLLKDIVIPKGTIFSSAPTKTVRLGEGHIEAIFCIEDSKDTSGSITYYIDPCLSEEEKEIMQNNFLKVSDE